MDPLARSGRNGATDTATKAPSGGHSAAAAAAAAAAAGSMRAKVDPGLEYKVHPVAGGDGGKDLVNGGPLAPGGNNAASAAAAAAAAVAAEEKGGGFSRGTMRERLAFVLATSRLGMALESLNTGVSFLACVLYMSGTYVTDRESLEAFATLDVIFAVVYLIDYCLQVFAAQERFAYVFSLSSLVDLVTILPGLTGIALEAHGGFPRERLKEEFTVLTVMSFFQVLRIFRALRIKRLLSFVESAILRQVYSMALSVVCLIYFASGLVHLVENTRSFWPPGKEYKELSFFDVIYLVVTTITTVGYGDIAPQTTPGRAVIMLMMCTTLVLVPRETNKLIALMGMTSVYARQSFKPNKQHTHVVVAGDVRGRGIVDFFRELFHADHGATNQSAVILGSGLPTPEIRSLLSDPRFAYMITYLDGNVMSDRDLKRASIESAEAVFLLTNKLSQATAQDDASCILRALSIQRYMGKSARAHKHGRRALCLQLQRSENRKLFASTSKQSVASGLFQHQVVCVDEIKMNILAKSCLVPGIVTMMNNLVESIEETTLSKDESPWLHEYVEGLGFEIYRVAVSSTFEGMKFDEVAMMVYERTGSLVFGLEIDHSAAGPYVVLNPGKFVLPAASETLSIYAFVLAGDLEEALLVSSKDAFRPPETGGARILSSMLRRNTKSASRPLLNDCSSSTSQDKCELEEVEEGEAPSASAQEPMKAEDEVVFKSLTAVSAATAGPSVSVPAAQGASGRGGGSLWGAARASVKASEESNKDMLFAEYYLHEEPEEFEAAHLLSVDDAFPPEFGGHIVVIGSTGDLYNFVLPLRARKSKQLIPIIVMSPTLPSTAEWQTLAMFKQIYFLRGSVLNVNDLARVRISTAAKAVIFAKSNDVGGVSSHEGALLDADTIFAYSIMLKENPDLQIVVELVEQSNITYIADSQNTQGVKKRNRQFDRHIYVPPFAAGNIFTSSMLDTLLAQAFYNPKLITILQHLVVGHDSENDERWYKAAQSQVPHMPAGSDLYLIPVPPGFANRSYGELLVHLLRRDILALGLRRGVDPASGIGINENHEPYVVTNPARDVVLYEPDCVFVLSQEVLLTRHEKRCATIVGENPQREQIKPISKRKSSRRASSFFRPERQETEVCELESVDADDGDEIMLDALETLRSELRTEISELARGVKELIAEQGR